MSADTVMTDEQIMHLWDTRVGDPTECMPLVDSDKTAFARAIEQAVLQSPEVQALRKDAERLDWLDATNAPFKMGWRFGIAPAGNVHPYTVAQLYGALTTVREGIDAAMEKQP